jgi:SPP1 family predicted phage head-tail adaptor
MRPMRAGQLRDVGDFYSPNDSKDGMGDVTTTYTISSHTQVRAKIEPLSGRELYTAQQVRPDITHRLTFRYIAGISSRWQFRVGSQVFELGPPLSTENRLRDMVFTAVLVQTT